MGFVVGRSADQGRVAVGRQRHGFAEPPSPGLPAAGQRFALLGPGGAGAGEHEGRSFVFRAGAVGGGADERGVAVGGQRHALPDVPVRSDQGPAHELFTLVHEGVDVHREARTVGVDVQEDATVRQSQPTPQRSSAGIARTQTSVHEDRAARADEADPASSRGQRRVHVAGRRDRQRERAGGGPSRWPGDGEPLLQAERAVGVPLAEVPTPVHDTVGLSLGRHGAWLGQEMFRSRAPAGPSPDGIRPRATPRPCGRNEGSGAGRGW